MSLREIQNFLAQVYTDENLRRAFLSEPERTGLERGLSRMEIAELAQVLPEELNFFAESLFYKRLREVEKLLPVTRRLLERDFEEAFREFARQFLPKTVKKHLEDAVNFAAFLQKKWIVPDFIKDLARFEQAKLKFNGYDKRFVACRFCYDIRPVLEGNFHENVEPQKELLAKRKTYAIWFRAGGKRRHFIW